MATKRRVKSRVKVSQRPDAMTGGEAIIVEVTSLASGAGLLLKVAAPRDGKPLYVQPYQADAEVYLEIRSHALDCELGGRGRGISQRNTDAERCDCGAALYYDAEHFEWKPLPRKAVEAPKEEKPREVRVRDLKSYTGTAGPRPCLHCQICGDEVSADAGDYGYFNGFMPDDVFTHCERPMVLVFKKTVYVEATP